MVEQAHCPTRADHMIIENTNVYSTPDQKGMMVCCSKCHILCNIPRIGYCFVSVYFIKKR